MPIATKGAGSTTRYPCAYRPHVGIGSKVTILKSPRASLLAIHSPLRTRWPRSNRSALRLDTGRRWPSPRADEPTASDAFMTSWSTARSRICPVSAVVPSERMKVMRSTASVSRSQSPSSTISLYVREPRVRALHPPQSAYEKCGLFTRVIAFTRTGRAAGAGDRVRARVEPELAGDGALVRSDRVAERDARRSLTGRWKVGTWLRFVWGPVTDPQTEASSTRRMLRYRSAVTGPTDARVCPGAPRGNSCDRCGRCRKFRGGR